ncbi:hypothetical protein [Nonomuraea basaltis]|nr:hypothetical protein [Nonomuraea basaltis]
MKEDDTRAYYDDQLNADAMCYLVMINHPGWVVWRLGMETPHRRD